MGIWPFGREPRDVDSASRIVTAATRDNRQVRAKLTVHFLEAQTQAEADEAADRCARLVEALFREAPGHEHLLENEQAIVPTLVVRLPPELPATRTIEIAALHVVGDPSSVRRRAPSDAPPTGAPRSAYPPASAPYAPAPAPRAPSSSAPSYAAQGGLTPQPPTTTRSPGTLHPPNFVPVSGTVRPPSDGGQPPASIGPPSSVQAPPPASIGPPPSARRRSISSSLRAVTASLVPPPGAPPAVIATSLSPLLRDAAARLLIGCLRAHDLLVVRRVTLDEGATELLAALVPMSDAPPGEFEASRATEIARWRGALGSPALDELRAEAWVVAAFLARLALHRFGVGPDAAAIMLEGLCQSAFPAAGWPIAQLGRYGEHELTHEAALNIARILGHATAAPLEVALPPLLESVQDDMEVMARLARMSLGLAP